MSYGEFMMIVNGFAANANVPVRYEYDGDRGLYKAFGDGIVITGNSISKRITCFLNKHVFSKDVGSML